LGAEGRQFESARPDHLIPKELGLLDFAVFSPIVPEGSPAFSRKARHCADTRPGKAYASSGMAFRVVRNLLARGEFLRSPLWCVDEGKQLMVLVLLLFPAQIFWQTTVLSSSKRVA
jgi:hypothetical protein